MKKWHILFLIAIAIAFLGLKVWQFHWPKAEVELKDQRLTVLVADNSYRSYRGLGKRDSLGNYDGMLFIYSEKSRHGIVMREMRFPIDIVWFDKGKVVDIASNVPVEPGVSEELLKKYYPRVEADLILELPAGWAEKNGLKIGDGLKTAS